MDSQETLLSGFARWSSRELFKPVCNAENVFAVTHGGDYAPVKIDFVNREALQRKKCTCSNNNDPSAVKDVSCCKPIEGTTHVRVVDDTEMSCRKAHRVSLIVCSDVC